MVPRKTFICSWRCDATRGKASQKRLQPNSFDRIGIHCREMAPTTHQSAPILARENFIVAEDHRHWLEPWIENGSATNLRTENQQRKDKEFPWTHSFDQNGFVKVKLARAYMFLGDDAMYRRSRVCSWLVHCGNKILLDVRTYACLCVSGARALSHWIRILAGMDGNWFENMVFELKLKLICSNHGI